MNKVLLDTDILSEILKRRDRAVVGQAREYRGRYGRFPLSAATVMEVVRGLCRLDAHKQLELFLDSVDEAEVLPVDEEIAILAGRIDGALLKAGQQVGINDVLIAATAMHYGLAVVTGNFEHYSRIDRIGYPLKLENWRDQ